MDNAWENIYPLDALEAIGDDSDLACNVVCLIQDLVPEADARRWADGWEKCPDCLLKLERFLDFVYQREHRVEERTMPAGEGKIVGFDGAAGREHFLVRPDGSTTPWRGAPLPDGEPVRLFERQWRYAGDAEWRIMNRLHMEHPGS